MTSVSALVTEGGHNAEQPHSFEDSEANECQDEASIIRSATYENPNAIEHDVMPEHQELSHKDLNTMAEGQEQTSPSSENVFYNTTTYPDKDMIMNEKVSHGKNSDLAVYNTLISL